MLKKESDKTKNLLKLITTNSEIMNKKDIQINHYSNQLQEVRERYNEMNGKLLAAHTDSNNDLKFL